jgi:hypothetical protein
VRQASIDLQLVHRSRLVFTTATGQLQSRRNALRALHVAGSRPTKPGHPCVPECVQVQAAADALDEIAGAAVGSGTPAGGGTPEPDENGPSVFSFVTGLRSVLRPSPQIQAGEGGQT